MYCATTLEKSVNADLVNNLFRAMREHYYTWKPINVLTCWFQGTVNISICILTFKTDNQEKIAMTSLILGGVIFSKVISFANRFDFEMSWKKMTPFSSVSLAVQSGSRTATNPLT